MNKIREIHYALTQYGFDVILQFPLLLFERRKADFYHVKAIDNLLSSKDIPIFEIDVHFRNDGSLHVEGIVIFEFEDLNSA